MSIYFHLCMHLISCQFVHLVVSGVVLGIVFPVRGLGKEFIPAEVLVTALVGTPQGRLLLFARQNLIWNVGGFVACEHGWR